MRLQKMKVLFSKHLLREGEGGGLNNAFFRHFL